MDLFEKCRWIYEHRWKNEFNMNTGKCAVDCCCVCVFFSTLHNETFRHIVWHTWHTWKLLNTTKAVGVRVPSQRAGQLYLFPQPELISCWDITSAQDSWFSVCHWVCCQARETTNSTRDSGSWSPQWDSPAVESTITAYMHAHMPCLSISSVDGVKPHLSSELSAHLALIL